MQANFNVESRTQSKAIAYLVYALIKRKMLKASFQDKFATLAKKDSTWVCDLPLHKKRKEKFFAKKLRVINATFKNSKDFFEYLLLTFFRFFSIFDSMRSFFRKFGDFFKERALNYVLGIFFLVFVDLIQIYVPEILKNLTNEFQAGVLTQRRLLFFAVLMIGTGLASGIGRFAWRHYIIGSARELEYEVRNRLFTKLLTLSPAFYARNKTGELMALATNDVNAIRMAAFQGVVMGVDSTFMLIMVIVRMVLNANLRLTLIALCIVPFLVVFVTFFGRYIHKSFRKVQEAYGDMTDTTQEIFSGIRVVKGFAQDAEYVERFQNKNQANYQANMKMVKLQSTFRPVIMMLSAISFLLVLFFGGGAVISGEIRLGDFIAFNMYLQLMLWPLMAFGMIVNVMQRGIASMERIDKLLSEVPEITDPIPNDTLERIAQKIEFENVSFTYPNAQTLALKDVSFTLEKNKSLAIIGTTGAGKSTIINLLLRLYDLGEKDCGRILIDGKPITKVSLKNLRESVASVPQESFLFSRSINDNITFAYEFPDEDKDERLKEKDFSYEYLDASNVFTRELLDEIQEVAKISDVHENIINFENSYDTILGERGVTLSGGQKQRTSIARAIFKKPEILILDDSFSAVDTETEKNIIDNLKKYSADTGLLIISHRVSTIKNCDEILVMDEGKIIERGNDESLMQKKGRYYEIAMQQKLQDELYGKEND